MNNARKIMTKIITKQDLEYVAKFQSVVRRVDNGVLIPLDKGLYDFFYGHVGWQQHARVRRMKNGRFVADRGSVLPPAAMGLLRRFSQ